MWRKIGRVIGVIFGWGVILAYILYASHLAQEHRAEQKVEQVVVSLSDSTAFSQLSSSEHIRKQLKRSGLTIENRSIDSIDAAKISACIHRNGFVKGVDVYATYSGTVYIDVSQHKPVMRLLCGGMNSYVTAEGDIFRAPRGSSYYSAVVTGGYRPFVGLSYDGNVAVLRDSLLRKEDRKLDNLEDKFAELKAKRSECKGEISKLKKQRKKKGFWESDEAHRHRKVGVDAAIAKQNTKLKQLAVQNAALEAERVKIDNRKKKLNEKYNDFVNLINFVVQVEEDSFWQSEVVQFVADTLSTGAITLRLVPRSGDFIIEFGTLADSRLKLDKLHEFYDNGLSRVGWNRYKVIDIRYDKQVICTE